MKLEKVVIEQWIKDLEFCLPGLLGAIKKQKSHTFLIGASIFDIFQMQGWLKKFSRRTGDADFTIEYLGNPSEYLDVCNELLRLGYRKDEIHPYRYYPQKIGGMYGYVDFLTYTIVSYLESKARAVMSVGESFNFEGMFFAKHKPLHLEGNVYIPNPIALIYLKMRSYNNNPQRQKDFVDLVELILRLSTESKVCNELRDIIGSFQNCSVKEQIEKMCFDIEFDKGGLWDLDNIKSNMEERGLMDEFEWKRIPEIFEFFRIIIF